jgi:thiamine-phosphate pyrophosphorylase
MTHPLLRLIDANANRAREALRVLEDYARFILNREDLCHDLKTLRHDLTTALRPFLADAVLHRDTPGDVGTTATTPAEQSRDDLNHIVTAAGKRLGEALRSLEEYAKTLTPSPAPTLEALRYRFYDLEQRLALTLRPLNALAALRLYVLITESVCRRPWLEAAEQAILGGADCLQLREKNLDGAALLDRAKKLVELCKRHHVLSLINDRPDIALLSGADGVHLGQEDLPAREARKLLGNNHLIGVSTHHLAQARQAVLDGADYLGVGPVFPSPTKPRDILPGPAYAQQVAQEISIPAIAIGGICAQNVDQLRLAGVRAIAVTAAVLGCDDPRAAAMELKNALATDEHR